MPSWSRRKAKFRHSNIPWPRVVGIAVLLLLILGLYIGGRHWLSIDSLRAHRDELLKFVTAHYWVSFWFLGLVTVAQTAVSLPFSPLLVILAGIVFGLWVGTVLKVIATTIGSVFAIIVVRHLIHDFASRRVRRHPKAEQVLETFDRHPNSYLLFLRFEPGMPLWLANIVAGLIDISLLRFSLLTLVGVIPDTFVFANIGANLAKLRSAHDLLSPGIIVALSLLALVALVPMVLAWRRRKRRRKTVSPKI